MLKRLVSLLVAMGGCAAAQIPHTVVRRHVELAQTIYLEHLPPDSRITLEGATSTGRVVLANRVHDAVELSFAYNADERVDNGVVDRSISTATYALVVQAPGYLPRDVRITVPAREDHIDARLQRPPLRSQTFADGVRTTVDEALDQALAGRCEHANLLFARVKQQATPQELSALDEIAACSPVSPLASPQFRSADIEVPEVLASSPLATIGALRTLMQREHDEAGALGLDRLVAAVSEGRLLDAAYLAQLVAGPLPGKRAFLTLELPTALLAYLRAQAADTALTMGDTQQAFTLAAEARHIDARVAASTFDRVRGARISALVASGNAAEQANDPLLARAYYVAAEALAPGDASVSAALQRTLHPALDTLRLNLAVASIGGWDARALFSRFLAPGLPPHVVFAERAESADAVVSLWVGLPERTYTFAKTYRTTEVVVGSVDKPNPDYEIAVHNRNAAAESLDKAQESYDELHAQSQQTARQGASMGGGYALAMGLVAGGGEAAGIGILKSAQSDLREAEAELARTPRTLKEKLTESTSYPVIRVTATATAPMMFRLEGFGDPVDETATATAQASADQVVGDPDIGVSSTQPDTAELAQLAPSIDSDLKAVAGRFSSHIREAETNAAWAAFATAQGQDVPEAAAALGAAFLVISGDTGARRDRVINFLVEKLP